ncbi:methyltransferase [Pseudomonas daroniae]|uniref:Protein MgtC n=1 Tax=Phytopseudomonas daroniae TaxID=2487519 RepID=A0A4V2KAA1_9GAMM|nr:MULTISPECIES: MgtC/SapB family protein [Pseudomonas]TBU72772.1 methyltransferase [Pseudomonas daroniae]TBU77392.1 methyltransferase [Pseudomonas daroniae]TBU77750.1 methyltransferase [Pseudomonas sp. FRB 228]TBU87712.1 methyltransferase [Pseudomonas daroniae]
MLSFWDEVLATLANEFSDLSTPEQFTQVTLRLLLAALLGGLLGLERETHGKAAGVRTHMLVAMGSALFVLVPAQMGAESDAMSRVIQGLVAGIGFLCAGTIIKGSSMAEVKGLTTAAGIWLTAAIGITVGMGREATAVLSTLLALFIFNTVQHFVTWLEKRAR